MKKIIISAFIIVICISIPAIFFFSDYAKTTAWLFTFIDLSIIGIVIYYFKYSSRLNSIDTEDIISSFEDSSKEEMFWICTKITEENKEALSNALLERINCGDDESIKSWYGDYIPQFIRKKIIPEIKRSVPDATYKKIMFLSDKMNILVFKMAFENIEDDRIGKNLVSNADPNNTFK